MEQRITHLIDDLHKYGLKAMDDDFVRWYVSLCVNKYQRDTGLKNVTPEGIAKSQEEAIDDCEDAWLTFCDDLRSSLFLDLVYKILTKFPAKSLLKTVPRAETITYMRVATETFFNIYNHTEEGTITRSKLPAFFFPAQDALSKNVLDIKKHPDNTPILYGHALGFFISGSGDKCEFPIGMLSYPGGTNAVKMLSGLSLPISHDGSFVDIILEYYFQILTEKFIPNQDVVIATRSHNSFHYKKDKEAQNKSTNCELIPLYAQMPFIYLAEWLNKYTSDKYIQQHIYPVLNYKAGADFIAKYSKKNKADQINLLESICNKIASLKGDAASSKVILFIVVTPFTKKFPYNPTCNILEEKILNPKIAYPISKTDKSNVLKETSKRSISLLLSYLHSCIISYRDLYAGLYDAIAAFECYTGSNDIFNPDKECKKSCEAAERAQKFWYEFLLQAFRLEVIVHRSVYMKSIFYMLTEEAKMRVLPEQKQILDDKFFINKSSLFTISRLLYMDQVNNSDKTADFVSVFRQAQDFLETAVELFEGDSVTSDNFCKILFKIFIGVHTDSRHKEIGFTLLNQVDEEITTILNKAYDTDDRTWDKFRDIIDAYLNTIPR